MAHGPESRIYRRLLIRRSGEQIDAREANVRARTVAWGSKARSMQARVGFGYFCQLLVSLRPALENEFVVAAGSHSPGKLMTVGNPEQIPEVGRTSGEVEKWNSMVPS